MFVRFAFNRHGTWSAGAASKDQSAANPSEHPFFAPGN
jgi:hypothetical protein